jgi:hypothetical protein
MRFARFVLVLAILEMGGGCARSAPRVEGGSCGPLIVRSACVPLDLSVMGAKTTQEEFRHFLEKYDGQDLQIEGCVHSMDAHPGSDYRFLLVPCDYVLANGAPNGVPPLAQRMVVVMPTQRWEATEGGKLRVCGRLVLRTVRTGNLLWAWATINANSAEPLSR